MTQLKYRAVKTNEELTRIAEDLSGWIHVRERDEEGNCKSVTRRSTRAERSIIKETALAALCSLNFRKHGRLYGGEAENTALDMAEYMLILGYRRIHPMDDTQVNAYLTLYRRLSDLLDEWPEAEDED